nr:hypothetical protein [Mycobacterium pseudoshottsii]
MSLGCGPPFAGAVELCPAGGVVWVSEAAADAFDGSSGLMGVWCGRFRIVSVID